MNVRVTSSNLFADPFAWWSRKVSENALPDGDGSQFDGAADCTGDDDSPLRDRRSGRA